MSKHNEHASTSPVSKTREDAFSAYEYELRALIPSSDEILREAKLLSQARKKAKKRSIHMTILLLVLGTVAIDPAWKVETMSTRIGKQATYKLHDGSVVVLNTDSVLRVEHHIRSRQLQLVQGEAAFNASHGWRPFTVVAQDVRVRDIGTRFDVRLKPTGVRVVILDGAIEVSLGDQHQILSTGESIESHLGVLNHLQRVNPDHEAAWQQGKLVFNGTPLSQVISEVQRYSTLTINVDRAAAGMRVSGVYDITAVDTLIKDLPQSLPVEVLRNANGEMLIRKAHQIPS